MTVQLEDSGIRQGRGRRPAPGETLRQAWREFRSMRTALILLVVLAAASILGSLFPQQGISPQRVAQYFQDHPGLAPVLDRLGLFDVFGSAWYMAIYLALLAALLACLVPRTRAFAHVLRSRPPRGGRLDRYRTRAGFQTAASPEQATAAAGRVLARHRYRLARHDPEGSGPEGSGEPRRGAQVSGLQGGAPAERELAGEKGYLREAGSLLFHVSLLVLLVGLAYGKGFGYRGQAAIVEGETWANARVGYDTFSPGRFFGTGQLAPFQLRLDDFSNSFYDDGTPREFVSRVAALDLDGRQQQAQGVAPNRPMTVDGVRVFQSDYGYVPMVRVVGGDGKVLKQEEVLTLRDPATEVSTGAVKVTAARPQVGLELTMFTGLRTAPDCPGGLDFCNDPRLVRPVLVVLPFQGDLRASRVQSVFSLDHDRLEPLGGRPLVLGLGQTGRLANGMQVSFGGLKQYSVLTLARDPGVPIVGVAAALLLLGLLLSLYVTRRRVWVRASPSAGGAAVEVAGLALQGKAAFAGELARLAEEIERGTLDPARDR
ncbi:MAG TPA: cytochrome c biogenesis protein ResB [Actinomycetota bacterium]|nr:cytochrome c biogenesis protein ResB [Actinomycetota bacterium]